MKNFPITEAKIKSMFRDDEMSDDTYQKLYEYYFHEMPYGTAKARDGDPYEWIWQRLEDDFPYLIP